VNFSRSGDFVWSRDCCSRAGTCKAVDYACCSPLLTFINCLILPTLVPRFSGVRWTTHERSRVRLAVVMARVHRLAKHD
jgi:hypothetical protein